MLVLPAIDIRGGRVVRLLRGNAAAETVYGPDPLRIARKWIAEGARYLHVVDLDGAFAETIVNQDIVRAIAGLGVAFEVGGGIRSIDDVEALLDAGADRVVVGTAAVEDPELVSMIVRKLGPKRVVVGLDVRGGRVAVRGWAETTDLPVVDLAIEVEARGVERVIYTDIVRDGTLGGPNEDQTARLIAATDLRVIASGGIATTDQVRNLRRIGCEGVIIGRAFYEGTLLVADALKVASDGVS